MNKELEAVAADFHRCLWIGHAFAAWHFLKRRRFGWASVHVVSAVISFIASREHARDAHSED